MTPAQTSADKSRHAGIHPMFPRFRLGELGLEALGPTTQVAADPLHPGVFQARGLCLLSMGQCLLSMMGPMLAVHDEVDRVREIRVRVTAPPATHLRAILRDIFRAHRLVAGPAPLDVVARPAHGLLQATILLSFSELQCKCSGFWGEIGKLMKLCKLIRGTQQHKQYMYKYIQNKKQGPERS